ncbi:hypothetical protein [uncultured Deefgea sp.]|uniref:hypothetical protein n=1 Tax=uncultured Deefgea sp. TaxID=1304914 RepID=UPI002605AD52|nr:hypothetical protein [uncultured Deefgea sp.]
MTKSKPLKKLEDNFPRWFYTLHESAEKLNTSYEYLIHLGETSRLEILWRISDLEMSFADVKLNVNELPEGLVDVDFLPLRPKQVRSLKNEHLFFSDMYVIGFNGLVALSKYTTQKQTKYFRPLKYEYNEDFEAVPDSTYSFPSDQRKIAPEDLYISAAEFNRLASGEALNQEQSAGLQQVDASAEERKIPKQKENKLLEAVALLAGLNLSFDELKQPRGAAEKLIKDLEIKGYPKAISSPILADYIKLGSERISK